VKRLVILLYTEALIQIMIGKIIIQWTVYGTIAGAPLAVFFYFLDGIFNVHLYLFLLNIDFLNLPEYLIYNPYFQLFLHFIISVFLLAMIDSIASKLRNSPFQVSFLLNALMSFYFLPSIFDGRNETI
jgi:hypothetical protein